MTRAWWIILPGEALRCSAGHVIRMEWGIPEDGFPRCRHRTDATHHRDGRGPECGRRIYVLAFPRRGGRAGAPLMLSVDVSSEEVRQLLERAATVEEILTVLGLTWRPTIPPLAPDAKAS